MIWKLDQTQAEFQYKDWQGLIDTANPEHGLKVVSSNDATVSDVLGVAFQRPNQPSLQDCYIRQNDLIVVYPPRESRKFNVQLDYRLLDAQSESLLIELWISVQTYLLDNHPVVSVHCPFSSPGFEGYRVNADGRLELDTQPLPLDMESRPGKKLESRKIAVASGVLPRSELAIAWFNHPRDQLDTTWSYDPGLHRVDARLFGHFMEKGVIRRARMRCLIRSQPLNAQDLQAAYDAFVASPLPLTA